MKLKIRFFLHLAFFVFVTQQVEAVTLHVSVKGNDKWSGQLALPNKENTNGPLASLAGIGTRFGSLNHRSRSQNLCE